MSLRLGRGLWRLCGVLALALACTLLVGMGLAQSISYTVQVVAVSDEGRVLALQRDLSRQSFPAYVLTVPTEQGLVYRLRVGAFANRAAAVRFAEALPAVGGNPATPALAESVPMGLIPLEPELLERHPAQTTEIALIPWGAEAALRFRPASGAPATYRLPDGRRLVAWRARLEPDGSVLALESLELWPPTPNSSAAEREAHRQTVLSNAADRLGVTVDALLPHVFTPEVGSPFLAVLARFVPASGDLQLLPALGQPDAPLGPAGPQVAWLESGEPLNLEELEPLTVVGGETPNEPVSGEGWQAEPDAGFARLGLPDAERRWRALPGTPLLGAGDLLLVLDGAQFILYALRPR